MIVIGKRKCLCGNAKFFAYQICYHDILVDGENDFLKNVKLTDVERPCGPYRCMQCNTEYENLEELDGLDID